LKRNPWYRRLITDKFLSTRNFYGLELKCLLLIPIGYLVKLFLAFPYKNRKIWIIGENFGECLKDNGYCFFKYCQKNGIQPVVFFVSKKNSHASDQFLCSNQNVLVYGSIRHLAHLFLADVFIYSHTHRDLIYHKLFPLVAGNKKIVFLQHGVTGFKKFYHLYQEYCNEPDILIVVSEFEKSIIAEQVGTKEQKLKITGFARYDNLTHGNSGQSRQQIAYMPTWRDWINMASFLDSKFYKSVSSFTADSLLAKLLKEKGVTLKFYLHKQMKDYFSFFESKSSKVQLIEFGRESVQKMIKESNLLITDYSSVSWDFFYLDKPVIFYQFDAEDYLSYRGSYLDINEDIFGDQTDSKYTLIDLIKLYIENDFQAKEKYKKAKQSFFKYSDQSNCKRIYQEIMRL